MFTNVSRAIASLHKALENGYHITLYGDYDTDGLCGVLICKGLLEILKYTKFSCVNYTSRTHGLDTRVRSEVLSNQSRLCFIVDTGSGGKDFFELRSIARICDVIVADHHEEQYDFTSLPSNVCMVNPTVLDKYPHLSGACVAYEIAMAYLKNYKPELFQYGEKSLTFFSFAALYADSIYGDNTYCRMLYAKAQTCMLPTVFNNLKWFNISKRFILFSFAPLINACFRNEAFHVLNELYLKSGILTHSDRNQFLSEMEGIREYSRMLTEVLVKHGRVQVIGEFVVIDLSGMLNQSVPNTHIWHNKGLVANHISSIYKKCCISVASVGSRYLISCRDFYNRDMYRLFSTLYKVGGHKSAFGGEFSMQEMLGLPDRLKTLSRYVEKPIPLNIVGFEGLTETSIQDIAASNEFLHEKDVRLVRVPRSVLELKWTPESFSDRYEQFELVLPSSKVWIKLEEFARNSSSVLVHFYKSTKLKGDLVPERGLV